MTGPAELLPLLAMAGIGLLGAGHCVGMCGGIASALGFAGDGEGGAGKVLGYNLGRILSYGVAGMAVASLGYWGREFLALGPALRVLAGIILVLLGLYLAGWWNLLVYLERGGARLWRRLQPLSRRLLPVATPGQAVLVGMLWGWLPCGLVYSALAYAATAATPWQGGLMMVSFGLGTAPAMVAGGLFASRARSLLQRRQLRVAMALAMIAFGCWTLASQVFHSGHDHDSGHAEVHHHH